MNRISRNKTLIVLFTVFLYGTSVIWAQDCYYPMDTTLPVSAYNNDISFPSGSAIAANGDLKIIKTKNSNGFPDSTFFISISSFMRFNGPLTLDASTSPFKCKFLDFKGSFDLIDIDGYLVNTANTFPIRVSNSLHIDKNVNGFYEINGDFNLVTVSSTGQGSSLLFSACLDECDADKICQTSFSFEKYTDSYSFTNASSLNNATANTFNWDFGDGSTSTENNPIHTFSPGNHKVCLSITDTSCIFTPSMVNCENIIVNDCLEGNFSITPNGDQIDDDIEIYAGSKIYDRHGFLVANFNQTTIWNGSGTDGRKLPTGYYQVICGSGGTFGVTVIR